MSPFVELRHVEKIYGSGPTAIPVLRGVSLTIAEGQRLALLGKSGSGKSTLLNLLGGLDAPTSGTILVGGRELGTATANERARHRLETVGMIFQAFHLIPKKTALENVELPLVFAGIPGRERSRRAQEALHSVGLGERMQHLPNELSGGERQRVAIARALVNRPRLILADEPTGNLDSQTGREIVDWLLRHVQDSGAGLVLVTHDEELAAKCASRILRMNDGLIAEATTSLGNLA